MSDEHEQAQAGRKYKAVETATGRIVGFNHAVDLRIAVQSGQYRHIEEPGAMGDPRRNYAAMNTEQVLAMCVARNIPNYMSLTREQQVQALRERDREDDDRAERHAQAARQRQQKWAQDKQQDTTPAAGPESPAPVNPDLAALSLKELQALAAERGIAVKARATKAELLAALAGA